MASDALSEPVNCNCCHCFPSSSREYWKFSGINDGSKFQLLGEFDLRLVGTFKIKVLEVIEKYRRARGRSQKYECDPKRKATMAKTSSRVC